jgi:hypothetical protein
VAECLIKCLIVILRLLTLILPLASLYAGLLVMSEASFIWGLLLMAAGIFLASVLHKLGAFLADSLGIPSKEIVHHVKDYKRGRQYSYSTYERGGFEIAEEEHRRPSTLSLYDDSVEQALFEKCIALLEHEDPAVRSRAATALREAAGRDFGEDKEKWQQWLENSSCERKGR